MIDDFINIKLSKLFSTISNEIQIKTICTLIENKLSQNTGVNYAKIF